MAKREPMKIDLNDSSDLEVIASQLEQLNSEQIGTNGTARVEMMSPSDQAEAAPMPAGPSSPMTRQELAAQSKTTMALMIGGIAVASAILVGIVLYFVLRTAPTGQNSKVPNVVGQPLSFAQESLSNAGLTRTVTYDAASGKPAGTVVALNPPAGSPVSRGASVAITVAGAAPANAGKTPPAATPGTEAAPEAGTAPATPNGDPAPGAATPPATGSADPSAVAPSGGQTAGQPETGTKPIESAPPTVVPPISDGKPPIPAQTAKQETVTLGEYTGRQGEDVMTDLQQLGLSPSISKEKKTAPSGTVVSTDPPAGSRLPSGSKVLIIVAE